MERRAFTQLLPLLPLTSFQNWNKASTIKKNILPKKLTPGDTIGLIAPGSPFSDKQYQTAIENIKSLGFQCKEGTHLHAKKGFLAGSDQQRINDIHDMFEDPKVDAIWCLRGGYGTARLLPLLDYKLIKKHPKIILGYSDITALLNAIHQCTGLITFHGPIAGAALTAYSRRSFETTLMQSQPSKIPSTGQHQLNVLSKSKSATSAQILGGNLSLVAALCGTDKQIDYKAKILFLEDIGERPYRIDRMLTQVHQAIPFDKAKAILLGQFQDCAARPDSASLSLEEVFKMHFSRLDIPVLRGYDIGHVDDQCIIPIGAEISISSSQLDLKLPKVITRD